MPIDPVKYLILANAAGFLISAVNGRLQQKNRRGIPVLTAASALLGGSLGAAVAAPLFGGKAKKDNMLLRVFLYALLTVHVLLLLAGKGFLKRDLTFDLIGFFRARPSLLIFLAAINAAAFFVYGLDKRRARMNRRRVPIVTLLTLAAAGGSVGSLAAMYIFRHKTQKSYFTLGVPLILMVQLLLLFFVMNLRLP